MEKYRKRALRIFQFFALLIVLIGLIMVLRGENASGIVGAGRTSSGRYASLNGRQVSFIGINLLAFGCLSTTKIKNE